MIELIIGYIIGIICGSLISYYIILPYLDKRWKNKHETR